MSQCVFGWFEAMLGQESRVRSLMRFGKGGKLHEVSYEAWLRWYSPLSSRGVTGGAP